MRKVAYGVIALVVIGIGVYGWYGYHSRASFPPKASVCYGLAQDSIDSARAGGNVSVPTFAPSDVSFMRCGANPGSVHFEIAGTDTVGNDFHIYETSGGMAASGADTVFDYCYTQNGTMVSGLRMTGREGTRSQPTCSFDPSYLTNASETYEFGSL